MTDSSAAPNLRATRSESILRTPDVLGANGKRQIIDTQGRERVDDSGDCRVGNTGEAIVRSRSRRTLTAVPGPSFRVSGDPHFLEQARYWAWTGVPFVYLTAPLTAPVQPVSGTQALDVYSDLKTIYINHNPNQV